MTDDHQAAIRTLKRLFFAVSVADGDAVWDELGERARAFVLNLAVQQGMDFELGSRLRNGTATAAEQDEYLRNLVYGITRDLDGIDLSNLAYAAEDADDGRIRVRYMVPLGLSVPVSRSRATSDPTTSDPTTSNPTTGDPTAGDPTAGDATRREPATATRPWTAPAIPAGSALLALEVGAWKIDRLIPRP